MSKPTYVWLDLETTGLDPEACGVLEIAAVTTDADLNILGEAFETLCWPRSCVWEAGAMALHVKSGLLDDLLGQCVVDSTAAAWQRFASWLPTSGKLTLAGKSVHFDRSFMPPEIGAMFSHRHLDVSAIKMADPDFKPYAIDGVAHRAMNDTLDALSILQQFRRDRLPDVG